MHPLKKYLKENHINIGIFCKSLDISRQSLHNIVNYKFCPRRKLAKKIEILTNKKISVLDLLYPEQARQDEVKNAN